MERDRNQSAKRLLKEMETNWKMLKFGNGGHMTIYIDLLEDKYQTISDVFDICQELTGIDV